MDPLSSIPIASIRSSLPLDASRMLEGAVPVNHPEKITSLTEAGGAAATGKADFSTLLGQFVDQVNGKQAAASEAVNGLISGQNVSLHQTMIAMEEASVSFQLMVEVRNKLLESYQEIMRMQI